MKLVTAIINVCADGMRVVELENSMEITPWRGRYTLLWMLKHELLEKTGK